MEEYLDYFLQNPNGQRYDLLIKNLNKAGSEQAFIVLGDLERKHLLEVGVSTFGSEDLFYQWIWTTLGKAQGKPIDMIRMGELSKVIQMLGRIDHTVYS